MDVIALHQAGFAGAVAPLGTALTEEQLDVLWQLSPAPILCFDGDAAGARAANRAVDLALPHLATDRTIRIARLPSGEDPDTLVRAQGPAGFTAVIKAARPLAEALFDQVVHEVSGTATPEQRGELFKKLKSRAARIGDRGLAFEYQKELTERCNALLGRSRTGFKRGAGASRSPATILRPVPGLESANAERLRALTAILLRHPVLLPKLEEAYATLPRPPVAQRLFDATQRYAAEVENLDSAGLIAHLLSLPLADDVAWAFGNKPLPLNRHAGPDATVLEAEAAWWNYYRLLRRGNLEADVAASERDAISSNATQSRHVKLSAELHTWRGGGPAADAEGED
jgi:DNA primase